MNSRPPQRRVPNPKPPEEGASLNERKLSLRRYSKPRQGNEDGSTETNQEPKKKVKAETDSNERKLRSHKIGRSGTSDGCKMTPDAFQEFMETRKAEVKLDANGKRIADLGRIAGMKSRIGIHPLALFPKEIWTMIIAELSPEDRENMCKVHDAFLDLMERNLIRDVLFPLVIDKVPLAQKYLPPLVDPLGKLDLAQLVNLRLVSKSLRDVVDKWIEECLLLIMRIAEWPYFLTLLNTVRLQMSEELRSVAMAAVSNTSPGRFFLRSLTVVISPRRSRDHLQLPMDFLYLRQHVTALLEKIGDQILHFHLVLDAAGNLTSLGVPLTLKRIYDLLRNWLLLMPKLKWLMLTMPDLDLSDVNRSRWIGNAMSKLQSRPMPTLNELERLDLWENPDFPIWECAFTANPHVKYLSKRTGRLGIPCNGLYTSALALSSPLENAIFGGSRNKRWDFTLFLPQISNNNWGNLKRMTLWKDFKENFNSIASVFEFLEKFPTLEDVELHLNHVTIGDQLNFLRLPNLKNFKIEFGPVIRCLEQCKYFFSLQFLLHCCKLETLWWKNLMYDSEYVRRIMGRQHDHGEGMINFKGGIADLCDSNIWKVFPKLESIQVYFRQKAVKGRFREKMFIYSRN